ncbi:hypothetical protein DPEC_G00112600 [Dallia pectoralis]|uniref:Uncharacterized protein n=1 Tax=Dallia pectoralis TaxID=75939 RepID=A0ACC2GT81_DALPE|nr:hypothetical protein DPEC_G00112600 [Dallia pectoralis]
MRGRRELRREERVVEEGGRKCRSEETGRRRMGDQQPEETPHQTLSLRPTETAAEAAVGGEQNSAREGESPADPKPTLGWGSNKGKNQPPSWLIRKS